MLVASDTSPICNLAVIGQLSLLQSQFGEIRIPTAVQRELDELRHADGRDAVQTALREGWISTQPVRSAAVARLLAATLDPGEAEAIALAMELPADLILLDERDGRAVAEHAGLRVTGVLGVLLRAKRDGVIKSVRQELDALRLRARFFVAPSLEERVLEAAGESVRTRDT